MNYSLVNALACLLVVSTISAAPPICRSCSKNCFLKTSGSNSTEFIGNGTSTEDLLAELESNRIKRSIDEGGVEFRACSRFQIEMLLIPLAIAMIPIGLSALILCTCCCGPKDSRGKLPDDFLANFPMSKKKRISSEDIELDFCDGYVQRKDSSRTKFSTVVSYIEARRESLWSVKTDGGSSISGLELVQSEATEDGGLTMKIRRDDDNASLDSTSSAAQEQQSHNVLQHPINALQDRLRKVASTDSIKKTRFSDTVNVISVESLSRR